jgi:hypothetical protein
MYGSSNRDIRTKEPRKRHGLDQSMKTDREGLNRFDSEGQEMSADFGS